MCKPPPFANFTGILIKPYTLPSTNLEMVTALHLALATHSKIFPHVCNPISTTKLINPTSDTDHASQVLTPKVWEHKSKTLSLPHNLLVTSYYSCWCLSDSDTLLTFPKTDSAPHFKSTI
jgi:hypothetical protein